jgi:hypothetical protein
MIFLDSYHGSSFSPPPSGYPSPVNRYWQFTFHFFALGRIADGGSNMADNNDIPFMQRVLDNHFLLVFLGVASPTVLYIVWGVMNIIGIPIAK